MNKARQKFFNDYLEIITFFVFLLTLLVIYVPSLIWEEEDMYKNESRSRMQALYNVENFHNILIGKYEEDGLNAVTLVNAVRDSVMADSTFLGDQSVKLNGEEFLVNVPRGFDVEYDTTFGQRRVAKETIVDTTVTVVMLSEDTGLEDTLYVQKRNLFEIQEDPLFLSVVKEATFERVSCIFAQSSIDCCWLAEPHTHSVVPLVHYKDLVDFHEHLADFHARTGQMQSSSSAFG